MHLKSQNSGVLVKGEKNISGHILKLYNNNNN